MLTKKKGMELEIFQGHQVDLRQKATIHENTCQRSAGGTKKTPWESLGAMSTAPTSTPLLHALIETMRKEERERERDPIIAYRVRRFTDQWSNFGHLTKHTFITNLKHSPVDASQRFSHWARTAAHSWSDVTATKTTTPTTTTIKLETINTPKNSGMKKHA